MRISFIELGWRFLWRDLRAGELRLLLLALLLAVAALSAVGFFVDRIKAGLARDAHQLLGADVVLLSDQPAPPEFLAQAQALGLRHSQTQGFSTMARASETDGGQLRLVSLKAVADGYPLRGSLRTSTNWSSPGEPTQEIPAPGKAWVDADVLPGLGLQLGQTLLLGDIALEIERLITNEPDRSGGFMNFAPRVMINLADLAATGLVQPASRVNYRLLLAGPETSVQAFVDWAQLHISSSKPRGLRLQTLQDDRPELNSTMQRAEKFLNLTALLAALLSAVALALAARDFAVKHLDDCAMLRVLGLPQRAIAAAYGFEFFLAGLFASLIGLLLGYAVHYGFIALLAGLIATDLPPAGIWPVVFGLGMGLTLLLAFGLPPVLQLARVPALRVIRRDVGRPKPASIGVLGLGLAGFVVLLLAASKDLQLGLIAVGGFAGAAVLFAGWSWLAVKLLRRLVNDSTAPTALVLATRQISARPLFAVLQISSLALGMLALVLLVLLRTDLLASWRQTSAQNAPNRFVINITPQQAPSFSQAIKDLGAVPMDWYPMIRARLVAINDQPLRLDDYQEERARRLASREFNLSYSAELPAHNQITAGRWQANEMDAISIEEGIAQTLGLKLGDRLRFEVAGIVLESRITSLRKVNWASMRANFFAMYPLAQIPNAPATYLSAFKAPNDPGFDGALLRQFPNITSINMTATINQIQTVLEQVIGALEFLFVFTLTAGLVVLFAAVSATRDERAREFAIMRALGASQQLLRQVQRIELVGVGALAGLMASLLAGLVSWALAKYVFEFSWSLPIWLPLAAALAAAVLALLAGWWSLRGVLRRPVMQTLRQAVS